MSYMGAPKQKIRQENKGTQTDTDIQGTNAIKQERMTSPFLTICKRDSTLPTEEEPRPRVMQTVQCNHVWIQFPSGGMRSDFNREKSAMMTDVSLSRWGSALALESGMVAKRKT